MYRLAKRVGGRWVYWRAAGGWGGLATAARFATMLEAERARAAAADEPTLILNYGHVPV